MNRIRDLKCGLRAVVQPESKQRLSGRSRSSRAFLSPRSSRMDCSLRATSQPTQGDLDAGNTVSRDYACLEVVLADGKLLQLGGTHKNKTGFDLHRIFVGSRVYWESSRKQHSNACLFLLTERPVGWHRQHDTAASILGQVFKAGFLPSALEIADRFTLKLPRNRLKMFHGCRLISFSNSMVNPHRSARTYAPEKLIGEFRPKFIHQGLGNEGCEAIWPLTGIFLRTTGYGAHQTQ